MIDEYLISLQKRIEIGSKVKSLIQSDVWKDVIDPLFDAIITDILGGKVGGRWVNGTIDKVEEVEEKLRYLQAYKAGVISVHQAIHQFIDDAESADTELKNYISQPHSSEMNESAYAPEKGE